MSFDLYAEVESAKFFDERREKINRMVEKFVGKLDFLWQDGEALDGDGTEAISKLVLLELDTRNGNLSNDEIERAEKELREVRI